MLKRSFVLFFSFILTGCAGLKIYEDPHLSKEKETGIPFYTAKPYLLVKRTGEKNKPVEIDVIYLPDRSKTYYAKPKSGFGSANLEMGFTNGIVTSFGQDTDTNLAGLVTSLAGVPGLLAGASKQRAEAGKIRAETNNLRDQASTMPELAVKVKGIAKDLDELKTKPGYESAFLDTEHSKIESLITPRLKHLANSMDEPGAETNRSAFIEQLTGLSNQLKQIRPDEPEPTGDAQNVWGNFVRIQNRFARILSDEKPKPTPTPVLTLYEILITESGTQLKEVDLPTNQP